VVLAAGVDRCDAFRQRVQDVQRLERAEPSAGLLLEELAELEPLDQFTDDDGDLLLPEVCDLLMVVLHQDRTVAQRIELARVRDCGFSGRIAMGVVELRRPADARRPLDDGIDLSLPAAAELALDLVLAGDDFPRKEVEAFDSAGTVHACNRRGSRRQNQLQYNG
jgi:hypothetical protein